MVCFSTNYQPKENISKLFCYLDKNDSKNCIVHQKLLEVTQYKLQILFFYYK